MFFRVWCSKATGSRSYVTLVRKELGNGWGLDLDLCQCYRRAVWSSGSYGALQQQFPVGTLWTTCGIWQIGYREQENRKSLSTIIGPQSDWKFQSDLPIFISEGFHSKYYFTYLFFTFMIIFWDSYTSTVFNIIFCLKKMYLFICFLIQSLTRDTFIQIMRIYMALNKRVIHVFLFIFLIYFMSWPQPPLLPLVPLLFPFFYSSPSLNSPLLHIHSERGISKAWYIKVP